MNIYDTQGYLFIDEIARHHSWLKVIIGARQVGKTYGVLHYHLLHDIPFILLRRTTAELEMIGSSESLNPFKAFEPDFMVRIIKENKFYYIYDIDGDGSKGKLRGMALSLAQVAHVRGFDGSSFKSIIYDEAIPEKGVRQLRTEGDSLLNAYTTINGNRELKGEPACRLWLLANSNNIQSPVLEALNLTDPVLEARRKKREVWEAGEALIIQPKSLGVLNKRRVTSLMKQLGEDGDFYKMAIENEFSYDYSPLIASFSIKRMKPLFSYASILYAWEDDDKIYFCRAKHDINPYFDSNFDRQQVLSHYLWLRRYYDEGLVFFSDMRLLSLFRTLFDINY